MLSVFLCQLSNKVIWGEIHQDLSLWLALFLWKALQKKKTEVLVDLLNLGPVWRGLSKLLQYVAKSNMKHH